jgi:hypothetical protein
MNKKKEVRERGSNLWLHDPVRPVSDIFYKKRTSFKYSKREKLSAWK